MNGAERTIVFYNSNKPFYYICHRSGLWLAKSNALSLVFLLPICCDKKGTVIKTNRTTDLRLAYNTIYLLTSAG